MIYYDNISILDIAFINLEKYIAALQQLLNFIDSYLSGHWKLLLTHLNL